MRSAVFHGAGRPLVIEDRPIPVPGPGQALIRVHRCGICASDLSMTSGGAFDVPHGSPLGHEYAGEVVELGAGSMRICVGDRVTALPMAGCGHCPACLADTPLHCPQLRPMAGGYGDYTLIHEAYASRLPQTLSFADGALVEPLSSALRGVNKLANLGGARVAVIGAGAIGIGAIFWASRAGAARVVAVARSRRAETLALSVGAIALVTGGEGLAARLEEALGGPADIVIEAAGARGTLQQAIELARIGGTVLSLGGCSVPDTVMPLIAMMREVHIIFSAAYGARDFRQAIDTLDAGAVSPRAMIGETISLDALPERFEAMRTGSHPARVMVVPGMV